eukprot:8069634-Heterocapsa_arctica.AAC.1
MDFSSLECVCDLRQIQQARITVPFLFVSIGHPAASRTCKQPVPPSGVVLTRRFSPALRHARNYVVRTQVLDRIPGRRSLGHRPAGSLVDLTGYDPIETL